MVKARLSTWLLLGCGGALIALGVWLNQPAGVLAKAIRICLECVGIG